MILHSKQMGSIPPNVTQSYARSCLASPWHQPLHTLHSLTQDLAQPAHGINPSTLYTVLHKILPSRPMGSNTSHFTQSYTWSCAASPWDHHQSLHSLQSLTLNLAQRASSSNEPLHISYGLTHDLAQPSSPGDGPFNTLLQRTVVDHLDHGVASRCHHLPQVHQTWLGLGHHCSLSSCNHIQATFLEVGVQTLMVKVEWLGALHQCLFLYMELVSIPLEYIGLNANVQQ